MLRLALLGLLLIPLGCRKWEYEERTIRAVRMDDGVPIVGATVGTRNVTSMLPLSNPSRDEGTTNLSGEVTLRVAVDAHPDAGPLPWQFVWLRQDDEPLQSKGSEWDGEVLVIRFSDLDDPRPYKKIFIDRR